MKVSPRRWMIAAGVFLNARGAQLAAILQRAVSAISRIGRAVAGFIKDHARDLLDLKIGIPVVLFTFVVVTVAIALLLGVWDQKTIIVITPFGMPVEEHRTIPYSGESLANLMADEFQSMIRTSDDFTGTTDYSSSKQYNPLPETPKIPVQTSFELLVHGVSVDEILKIWRYLRYNQENISGEVVRSGPGKVRLRARLNASSRAMYWEIPGEIDDNAIPSYLNDLAAHVFADLHPATLGRYYLANRRYQKATGVFVAWVRREPENASADYWLGYSLEKMEQFDLAMAAEERSNELQSHASHLALGMIEFIEADEADLMKSKDSESLYEEAMKYDRRAIAVSCPAWRCWIPMGNRYPNYVLNKGQLFERLRKFENALEVDKAALRIDGQSAGARANMGSTLLLMSYDPKTGPVEREQEIREAVAQIQCALAIKPYFPGPLSILVGTLLKQQKEKDTEQGSQGQSKPNADRVSRLPVDLPPCSKQPQWEASANAAETARPENDAEQTARWASLIKPDAEEPLFELGYILFVESKRATTVGEREQLSTSADEAFNRALRSQPEEVQTITAQAQQLQNLDSSWAGRFSQREIDIFNNQLRDQPDNTALYRRLGDAYFVAGQYDDAAKSYRTALNQFPGYGRLASFHVQLADALYLSNPPDLGSAREHYMAAERLGSSAAGNCLFQFRLAHTLRYSSSPDPSQAIQAYAKGKSLNEKSHKCESPSGAQFYTEFASALRERGDSKGASEIKQIALNMNPSLAGESAHLQRVHSGAVKKK